MAKMNLKKWSKKALAICLLSTAGIAQASIQSDLDKFFTEMGGGVNMSSGAVVKGQNAGYLVGGSMYARTPVRTINLISVTVPSISAGCGGIDAYLGAFSFINTDQLQSMAKGIMSNAIGYAFNLALETVCPQCKAVMNDLQDMVNKVNMNNMTTCQAAQGLVNGIHSQIWKRDNDQCMKEATNDSYFADWAAAMRGCSNTGGRMNEILNNASKDEKDPERRKRVSMNVNITWSAFDDIKQIITEDRELKEILMTMLGTTIYGSKSGEFQNLPTLGANSELISALMYGGETNVYRCDEPVNCLKPTQSKLRISQDKSMVSKITNLMSQTFEKMRVGEKLNDQERNFIRGVNAPVLRLMRESAMAGIGDSIIANFAEHIAFQHTIFYLESLNELSSRASMGSINQKDQLDSDRFNKAVERVKASLRDEMGKLKFNEDLYSRVGNFMKSIRPNLSHTVNQNLEGF